MHGVNYNYIINDDRLVFIHGCFCVGNNNCYMIEKERKFKGNKADSLEGISNITQD